LDLGIVGALALASILFLGIKRAISHYREGSDPQYGFAAVLLLFCALDGVMDSIISQPVLLPFLCMAVLARLASSFDASMLNHAAERRRFISKPTRVPS
jgi:hypothetical protein